MQELENILSTLGKQRTAQVLQKILPVINARSEALLASIQQRNWYESARLAHTLLATAHLFASPQLLNQLKIIERGDLKTMQHPEFPTVLQKQLQQGVEQLQRLSTEH